MEKVSTVKKALSALAVTIVFVFLYQFTPVFAALSDSMQGFAWGGTESADGAYDGMGWISMNSLDCDTDGNGFVDGGDCGGTNAFPDEAFDYGVHVPVDGNGDVTGHAWSEHYGWISFNEADIAGCVNDSAGGIAMTKAERVGNKIEGTARILSIRDEIIAANDGGYDGCISLDADGGIDMTPVPASIPPRFTLDGHAWSSDLGWISFSGGPPDYQVEVYDRRPNLTTPVVTNYPNLYSASFDPTTGEYERVTINFDTGNNGQTDVTTAGNPDYNVVFTVLDSDGGAAVYGPVSHNDSLGVVSADTISQSYGPIIFDNGGPGFPGIPYGYLDMIVCVDTDGDNSSVESYEDVDEFNELDNCLPITGSTTIVPPPIPDMTITVDRTQIRTGDTVTVTWDTDMSYPMNCRVGGPGLDTEAVASALGDKTIFDPSVDGSTGSRTSTALDAKSVYTIECIPTVNGNPIVSSTFTEIATVEVIGEIEEI